MALEARHISKSFGATRALDRAGLTVLPGEVHGLLGENGSGKSTLIRILAGYHAPEQGGRLSVRGRDVRLPLRPGEPRELGLRFVHQDLGLIPSLSVAENVRLDELATTDRRRISWRREREAAAEALARFGVSVDPGAPVEELTPAERALVAIVRALEALPRAAGLLVLDEPAAFLPRPERERLFGLFRAIADAGSSVLLVSHDVREAKAVADRVTVLRDGRDVGTVVAADVETGELVEMIIGHRLEPLARRGAVAAGAGKGGIAAAAPRNEGIAVAGLSGEVVREVSIDLRRGEVVGLAGLAGSGFDEVPYLLFGARRCRAGRLTLDGERDLAAMTPERALRAGIALLPADRGRDGGVGSLPVGDNVTLPVLGRYAARLGLDRRGLARDARRLLADHAVRPSEPRLPFNALSGGNQQRALLAKWLQTGPPLLLLDEPTRGVDVQARREITATIRGLAAGGVTVLCASSDHEQLGALCDRVLIFAGGRVARELVGGDVTKERIAEQCLGAA